MKKICLLTLVLILVFFAGLAIGPLIFSTNEVEKPKEKEKEETIENMDIKYYDDEKYYVIKDYYTGEYDYGEMDLDYYGNYDEAKDIIKLFNTSELVNYYEYIDFCEKWNIEQKYTDDNVDYMIISYASYGSPIVKAKLVNVTDDEKKLTVYIWEEVSGISADIGAYYIVIPVDTYAYKSEVINAFTPKEYENIVNYGSPDGPSIFVEKPIIYLYPEEEMVINVQLRYPSLLTTSYPKYENSWQVIASPDGSLFYEKTNRYYYGLYYEADNDVVKMKNQGFVVKGEDTASFLEEKLGFLGLNDKEINEFIIYWLPRMENNNYNFIQFDSQEEIDRYMPLEITPAPDCIIRILMSFKALDEKIDVPEQELIPQERYGYSVIEWGGREIK